MMQAACHIYERELDELYQKKMKETNPIKSAELGVKIINLKKGIK